MTKFTMCIFTLNIPYKKILMNTNGKSNNVHSRQLIYGKLIYLFVKLFLQISYI